MREQYPGVDGLRFLVAMLVFVYHFGFWHTVPADKTLAIWNVVDAYPLREWTHFGWIGVEVFFVISGFVISFSARRASSGAFLTARALRLAPAVWVCAPLTFLIYLAILNAPASQLLAGLTRTLFFFPLFSQIDGVYWTLGVEMAFYYLIWLMLAKNVADAPERLPGVFLAMSLTFWSAYFIASSVFGPKFHDLLLIRLVGQHVLHLLLLPHGCFFGLGILFSAASYRRLTNWEIFLLAGLTLACWLEIVGQNRIICDSADWTLSPWPALVAWTTAMLALSACTVFNRRLSRALGPWLVPIRTLGLMSYPVYLLHNPIGLLCFRLGLGGRGFFANLALSAVLILLTAWIVAARVEPLLRRRLKAAILALHPDTSPSALTKA